MYRPRPSLPPVNEPPPRLEGVNVLVVDDEYDSVELVAASLRQFGAIVRTAFSAAEALGLLDDEWPHVVVCDLAMPLVSGIAFVRRLRTLEATFDRRVRVVALTGFTDEAHGVEALASGFDVHVPKPFDPLTFATVVAMLAGRC